jgi:hypothetical protein
MDTKCMQRIKDSSAGIEFPKFCGQIIVSKDLIRFDSSFIKIRSTETEIKKIFELGLVFPDVIFGAGTSGDKFEFKRTFSTDTISITNVTELHFPNPKPNIKSFSFLVWQKRMANPFLYIFELRNDRADSKTTMKTFLKTAKLTAFGFCSILI